MWVSPGKDETWWDTAIWRGQQPDTLPAEGYQSRIKEDLGHALLVPTMHEYDT